MVDEQRSTDPAYSGKDKRVFERYPVDIAAVIKANGVGEQNRKIRDFCIGGMLLVDENHTAKSDIPRTHVASLDDLIEIHCKVPLVEIPTGKSCIFQARIVRLDGACTGVAFVNPDLAELQGLMDYVKSLQPKVVDKKNDVEGEQTGSAAGEDYAPLIEQCIAMVKLSLEPLARKSVDSIIDTVLETSKEPGKVIKQNALFESLELLNNARDRIANSFVTGVCVKLDNIENKINLAGTEKSVADISIDELSIVENDELDNWLADTGTIEAIERAHRDEIKALEKRLEVIFRTPIHRKNNPFGPGLFSQAFQQAVSETGIRHSVAILAYKVFKDELTIVLGDLYHKINALLIENDILRKFKYSLPKKEKKDEPEEHQPEKHKSVPEVINKNATDGQSAINEQTAGVSGSSAGGQTGQHADGGSPAAPGIATGDSESVQSGAAAHPSGGHGRSQQDIYELVDELRVLRKRVGELEGDDGHHAGKAAHARHVSDLSNDVGSYLAEVRNDSEHVADLAAQEQAERVLFTQNEVLQALANVEQNITQMDRSEIRKSIAAALRGGAGNENKAIGRRENRIINVSTSVFDTMLNDLQVPDNMRGWLAQMELPVLKMAVHDDTLYKDSDHLVRQVVNKIAKLGVLVGEEETAGQTGIRQALDWLINLIGTEFDGTETVFKRVADQLDVLIKAQDKKYEENIQNVIHYIDAHKGDLATDDVALDVDAAVIEEGERLEEWMRRVRRLQEGDWILFEPQSENPARLRVAWVAKHTGKIVFVNLEGKKQRVLHLDNLAVSLYRGDAETIGDANAPAMDRAQINMLQELHRELIHESTHDPLTGLINRREFEQALVAALAESRGSGVQNALCFIDIDQFKVINATCSNEAGDHLLSQMATCLTKSLSDIEAVTIARLGSDEFGILLSGCSLEEALGLAEELVQQVHKHRFEWDEQRISVSISLGLAQITEHNDDISSVIQAAESSCDIAKQTGGNRLQLYYAGHAKLTQRKEVISWVTKIDDILDNNRLYLRCQKIYPLNQEHSQNEREHEHYEILLGLTDESGKLPSIQDFIEAAEFSNRVGDIDRWVVKNSIQWISDNIQILDIVSSFSINLSGISISDETFIDFVLEQIDTHDVPAENLCFEITETAGVENLSDASHFINTIKDSGCRFSLDDFGSGMSSYAYLRDLPVDYLKIDGIFIKNIHNNESDYAVVKSICEISHFMGKRVIAEYAENEEILAVLEEIGVDYAQGYGVERPHLLDDLV